MAPSLAIARKYRGLHTGWETARGTVKKAAQCCALAKRQHSRGLFAAPPLVLMCFALIGWSSADEPG
jgi:hypothetical protein